MVGPFSSTAGVSHRSIRPQGSNACHDRVRLETPTQFHLEQMTKSVLVDPFSSTAGIC